MEGPSLVIATEEFAKFEGERVREMEGTAKVPPLKRKRFLGARSWGKHFLLMFEGEIVLRIHFLMFGSYRIDKPRENRVPKLALEFPSGTVYFYSCAIKQLEEPIEDLYDWTIDTMSPKWSSAKATRKLKAKPSAQVCDVLMDQEIFAGVGNIIKNEVQFRQRLSPETKIEDMSPKQVSALVKDAREYCKLFYKWKKANVLKRNWQIMRKKKCPLCGGPVTKRPTGRLKRISHWCRRDQPKL